MNKIKIAMRVITNILMMLFNVGRYTTLFFFVVYTYIKNWLKPEVDEHIIPFEIIKAINNVLVFKGGLDDVEEPNYLCGKESITALYYTVKIDKSADADINKLKSLEEQIENELFESTGKSYNIRILTKPLSIQIDRLDVPEFLFENYFDSIVSSIEKNCKIAPLGVCADGLYAEQLVNNDFSMFITAKSGYGKTQTGLSALLGLAATNDPNNVQFVVYDPKQRDWMPFQHLKHTREVVTEPKRLLEVTDKLVKEMVESEIIDYRSKGTLLFMDELADAVKSLTNEDRARFIDNIQRLGMRGRSVGLVMIACAQRAYDIPSEILDKFEIRVVGKVSNNNDAHAATGQAGIKLNNMQVGHFEVYPLGTSIKTFYVADTSNASYDNEVMKFINRINEMWGDVEVNNEQKVEVVTKQEFVDYLSVNNIKSQRQIINAHKKLFNQSIGFEQAKEYQTLIK